MSGFTASNLYGHDPTQVQPTPSATPSHQGGPEPVMATQRPTLAGDVRQSAVALVVLLGLAVILTQVSFRGEVRVKA